MGREIERKFLVRGDAWRALGQGAPYRQGYLHNSPDRSVRVRVAGEKAFLSVKGQARGLSRLEYEYAIPLADGLALLEEMAEKPLIEKIRYTIPWESGLFWEVDEFLGLNAGLLLAEIELEAEDQGFSLPAWVGEEVTNDTRYLNTSLARRPFSLW